jgi:two-component system, OmpR family, response regulator
MKLRVLVVDDDPLQLELAQRGLERDGFEVHGVAMLAGMREVAARVLPHIVLVDLNLPDAPEQRVIAMARAAAPGALLVLYSAWEDSKLRALAREHGADGFISKSESVINIGRRLRELHQGAR